MERTSTPRPPPAMPIGGLLLSLRPAPIISQRAGLASAVVGLVPAFAQIGIWGAVIRTIIRFIEGVGVGGEWGGSVLTLDGVGGD